MTLKEFNKFRDSINCSRLSKDQWNLVNNNHVFSRKLLLDIDGWPRLKSTKTNYTLQEITIEKYLMIIEMNKSEEEAYNKAIKKYKILKIGRDEY